MKTNQQKNLCVDLAEAASVHSAGMTTLRARGVPQAAVPEVKAGGSWPPATATLYLWNPATVVWLLIFAAVPIALCLVPSAWDVAVYRNAIRSLQSDHDPYLDAISAQKVYFAQTAHPEGDPPYGFVYSPIVIPFLNIIGAMPAKLTAILYWILYVVSVLATIWVGTLALEKRERRVMFCLAPLTVFFPALLANGVVLGGNIAYILYGLIFSTAAYGWRRNRWLWFYLSVLIAACVKAPLLCLVLIPAFTCRRQWANVAITFIAGLGLFWLTAVLWPTLFKHYIAAIDHQFLYYHDFGCSPAGLFSTFLEAYGVNYYPGALLFWTVYAVPLFGILLILSRRYLNGGFSFQQWLPVMLVGVILLNPRLLEYDLFPLTLPILVLAWRFTRNYLQPVAATISLALLLAISNTVAASSWTVWKFAGGITLIVYFLASCRVLLNFPRQQEVANSQAAAADPGKRNERLIRIRSIKSMIARTTAPTDPYSKVF